MLSIKVRTQQPNVNEQRVSTKSLYNSLLKIPGSDAPGTPISGSSGA